MRSRERLGDDENVSFGSDELKGKEARPGIEPPAPREGPEGPRDFPRRISDEANVDSTPLAQRMRQAEER